MSFEKKWNKWLLDQAKQNCFFSVEIRTREEFLSSDYLSCLATKRQIVQLESDSSDCVFILVGLRARRAGIVKEQAAFICSGSDDDEQLYKKAWNTYPGDLCWRQPALTHSRYALVVRYNFENGGGMISEETRHPFSTFEGALHGAMLVCKSRDIDFRKERIREKLSEQGWVDVSGDGYYLMKIEQDNHELDNWEGLLNQTMLRSASAHTEY